MNRVLLEGWLGDDPTTATFCANLLKLEPALWTFVTTEGVKPTNNFVERLLRRAVLWGQRSFGCWSEAGCQFVQRILTVVQTRRLRGEKELDSPHDFARLIVRVDCRLRVRGLLLAFRNSGPLGTGP